MGRLRLNPFRRRAADESRMTLNDYAALAKDSFGYAGNTYGVLGNSNVQTTMGKNLVSPPTPDFMGHALTSQRNSVVGSVMSVRRTVFSATRFTWQALNKGRPSEMFGDTSLKLLEKPWPGGTTQDLLARMIQDADLAGNSYWVRNGEQLVRLRPDWVEIVLSPRIMHGKVVGYETLGYVYTEGGHGENESVLFYAEEVGHFMPDPDPLAPWRGQSWLQTVLRDEVVADQLMTQHRKLFMENAATPNLVVALDREVSPEAFAKFKAKMDASHKGVENAYKTLYLGGGADVKVVGSDLQQMNFSQVQGAGETRIAAAAGVPPVIVGLSEGLQAATYSNYAQARRRFADGTIHPLWQSAVGSLEHLVKPPAMGGEIRLWYDSRDVPFLREDQGDAAEIQATNAQTIRAYVDSGFKPKSAVAAVEAGDLSLLEHSGLVSVQLLPPGTVAKKPDAAPPDEGTNTDDVSAP